MDSNILWNALKGIVCVYKPAEISVKNLRKTLITKICRELSDLDVKLRLPEINPKQLPYENHSHSVTDLIKSESSEILMLNNNLSNIDLRYHPNVIGPRYVDEDLAVSWSNYLGWNTSGVLLFGIRAGTQIAKYIRENRSTRAYRITGVFGKATDNGFKSGKVVERSTWKYIRREHIDKILSAMQAAHQKKMYEECGVDINSQLAYDLAVKGPMRPANSKVPIIYGLKCLEYQGPEFTIEVQCINENEDYLIALVHEIGIKLHSTAYSAKIKCIRHSCFTLEHALLPKHWTLENITKNIDMCNDLLRNNEDVIMQENVSLS